MKLTSSELDGILYGTLLGNASLNKANKNGNYNLTLSHSPKQKEYLEFKKELLSKISHVKFSFKEINFTNKSNGKSYKTYYYHSNYLRYFTKKAKVFYTKDRKKVVTRKILNKLTPLGIALWWMDDGSLCIHRRKDRGTVQRTAILATCSFSLEEHDTIIKYFKEKWDINLKVAYVGSKAKRKPVIRIPMKEFGKFKEIIEPYIIPSMKYKIDCKYVSNSFSGKKEIS